MHTFNADDDTHTVEGHCDVYEEGQSSRRGLQEARPWCENLKHQDADESHGLLSDKSSARLELAVAEKTKEIENISRQV